MDSQKTDDGDRRVTIVVSARDYVRLEALAARKRSNVSQVIREIVGTELDRQAAEVATDAA